MKAGASILATAHRLVTGVGRGAAGFGVALLVLLSAVGSIPLATAGASGSAGVAGVERGVGAAGVATADGVLVVDASGGGEYRTLDAALAAARPGQTVEIRAGTYPGGVAIETPRVTVRGVGDVVLVGGGSRETGLRIAAREVTVEGVTVRGYAGEGVLVDGVPDATLRDVAAVDNGGDGVLVRAGDRTAVLDSTARGNGGIGLALDHARAATVRGTALADNGRELSVVGSSAADYGHAFASTTVDGDPVRYLVGADDATVAVGDEEGSGTGTTGDGAGYVAVVNATNVTVRDGRVAGGEQGVLLVNVRDARVENVSTAAVRTGADVRYSTNVTVAGGDLAGAAHAVSVRRSARVTVRDAALASAPREGGASGAVGASGAAGARHAALALWDVGDALVRNVTVRDGAAGVAVDDGVNVTVADSRVGGVDGDAVAA